MGDWEGGALGPGGQGEGGEHARDENDFLAPGSAPTLGPQPPALKPSTAPRPLATPSAARFIPHRLPRPSCTSASHLPTSPTPAPLGHPACVRVHFYLNKFVW